MSYQIKIHKLKLSDADSFCRLAADEELRNNLPYPDRLKYKNDIRKYIQEYIRIANKRRQGKKEYQFGVFDRKTQKAIGFICLFKLDWKNQKAEVGYWMSQKYRNKGLTKEALRVLLDYAFKKLNLKKVCAEVNSTNISSYKLLEKGGFKLKRRVKGHHKINGKWTDQLFYEIINNNL